MDLTKLPSLTESLISKHESLLSKIFGAPLRELEETWADHLRYRRFTNQVKIFAKAFDQLKSKNITAKPIALKYLTPLIDLSSVEEDPKIQEKWANVIANLASYDSLEMFNKNCINLLGTLSADEIAILDYLYAEFVKERTDLMEKRETRLIFRDLDIGPSEVTFDPFEIGIQFGLSDTSIKLYVENLIALGLLQFEELELEDEELVKSSDVYLTYLGHYFVRLCKYR